MRKSRLAVAFAVVTILSMLALPVLPKVPARSPTSEASDQANLLLTTPEYMSEVLSPASKPALPQNGLPLSATPSYVRESPELPSTSPIDIGDPPEIASTNPQSKALDPTANDTVRQMMSQKEQPFGILAYSSAYAGPLPDLNGTEVILYGNAVGTSSYDPSRPPADPQSITKDGHWFPNKAYSQICYDFSAYSASVSFTVSISAGQDPYSRYFRIYLDGVKILETIMSGSWSGTVSATTTPGGGHRVILEVQWGYYSDHGWRLTAFKPSNGDVVGEFFPNAAYSQLRWDVYMGPQTTTDLRVISAGDPYPRNLRIYVDGVQKLLGGAPTPTYCSVPLGDYGKYSKHEVAVEVQWGYYMDWGWELRLYTSPDSQSDQFRVHYIGVSFEIDWMPGHQPSSAYLSYMVTYYKNHGYQRPELYYSEQVPEEENLSTSEYDSLYYNVYFDCKGYPGWKYVLFGHYSEDYPNALGWTNQKGGDKIFIADQKCANWASDNGVTKDQVVRVAMMHESGHSISIVDTSWGEEVYCTNSFCVMAHANLDSMSQSEPYYCGHHWSQRVFP